MKLLGFAYLYKSRADMARYFILGVLSGTIMELHWEVDR